MLRVESGNAKLSNAMCNRVVQKDKVIKPGERVMVLMKGPGATFELPFKGAVFAGQGPSDFATKAAHRENDEADDENESNTSTAVGRPAKVEAAAAQQDEQDQYD